MLGEATEDLMVDLHPPALDEYGLVPALRWYGDRVRRLLQARIQVEAAGDPLRLDHDTELGIFRIVQEALTNVTKHAEATDVRISIQQDRQETFVTVDDNGKGFDTYQVAGSDGKRRWGLAIMKERARAFGGTLHVESKPGCGTRVMLRLETSPA
jgi:signal transduction histidine kinase